MTKPTLETINPDVYRKNVESILIVDDEPNNLKVLYDLLTQHNYDVRAARDGQMALDTVQAGNPDIILLDIKMPGGMDGIETLREIKRIQPLVEVLLLTGHASVETSIEGMKQGAFDYLLKPMKFEDLLTKMAQAFEKKATHDKKIRDAKIQELIRYPSRVFEKE